MGFYTKASGVIGGASNLTTVGAIPYVSASGVLNQDATNLFWDATNKRLLLGAETGGTNSNTRLAIVGTANSYGMAFKTAGSGVSMYAGMDTGALGFNISNNAGTNLLRVVENSGNLLIGGTTDGNYKLDVANSGSSGTLRVYDQTATTGNTKEVIRAGAGQSTNLTEWQNSAGTVLGRIDQNGSAFLSTAIDITTSVWALQSNGLTQRAAGQIIWSSTSNYQGTADLGLSRNAAGVLEINNGTAGTYRDLRLRTLIASTSIIQGFLTPASASDTGTAGQIAWDTNYIYIATGTNTWKRVAIATW